jgi:hypothetical protein
MLLQKYTGLFPDVSPVTISGIIARERASRSNDMKTMDERIMKKVLWYRDLPVEENKVADQMSYDQASFKYQKPKPVAPAAMSSGVYLPGAGPAAAPSTATSSSSSDGKGTVTLNKVEKQGWNAAGLYDSTSSSAGVPVPSSPVSKTAAARPASPANSALPPMPNAKRGPVMSGLFKALPPPPSIAATPTSYTDSGFVSQSELRGFVVAICLNYLRSNANYSEFLTQNYLPFATHRTSLSSSVCQEVSSIVPRQITEVDRVRSKFSN